MTAKKFKIIPGSAVEYTGGNNLYDESLIPADKSPEAKKKLRSFFKEMNKQIDLLKGKTLIVQSIYEDKLRVTDGTKSHHSFIDKDNNQVDIPLEIKEDCAKLLMDEPFEDCCLVSKAHIGEAKCPTCGAELRDIISRLNSLLTRKG